MKWELDEETGLYYYGARYSDQRYSRWLSGDPAVNDYIPKAPIDDDAKKHNENLPGMGGVFNVVNLHLYHYAGNNPVKYVDPDGRFVDADTFYQFAKETAHKAQSVALVDSPAPGPCDIVATVMLAVALGSIVIGGTVDLYNYISQKIQNKASSKAETKTQESLPYHVKVQFQGPSIKGHSRNVGEGDKEVNIWSDKPIKAATVRDAVKTKFSSLSRNERKALADSYSKAMRFINNAEAGGGLAGPTTQSFDSRTTGKPGDRVDFVIAGSINLIP